METISAGLPLRGRNGSLHFWEAVRCFKRKYKKMTVLFPIAENRMEFCSLPRGGSARWLKAHTLESESSHSNLDSIISQLCYYKRAALEPL